MLTSDNIVRDGEGLRVSRDGQVTRIVADGERVVVPLVLMDEKAVITDAPLNRPGQRLATDAAATERREVAYADYLKSLSDGWRQPDPEPHGEAADAKRPTVDAAREAALAQRDRELADAWRGGAS